MKILYDGIGCNNSKEHTEEEFLAIMKRCFTTYDWTSELEMMPSHYQLQFKDWVLPDDFVFFTLKDWIEYSGAIVTD